MAKYQKIIQPSGHTVQNPLFDSHWTDVESKSAASTSSSEAVFHIKLSLYRQPHNICSTFRPLGFWQSAVPPITWVQWDRSFGIRNYRYFERTNFQNFFILLYLEVFSFKLAIPSLFYRRFHLKVLNSDPLYWKLLGGRVLHCQCPCSLFFSELTLFLLIIYNEISFSVYGEPNWAQQSL